MEAPKSFPKLCAPMFRCFPLLPTICAICKREASEGCPWGKTEGTKDEV